MDLGLLGSWGPLCPVGDQAFLRYEQLNLIHILSAVNSY